MRPMRTFDRRFALDPVRVWSGPISERVWSPDPLLKTQDVFGPRGATDVYETDKALVVHMSLPGFKPGEISIAEQHGMLTIRAEQRDQRREARAGLRIETQQSQVVQRSFRLPVEVDPDHAQATLQDGVLTITLPKARVSAARRIPITRREKRITMSDRGRNWLRRLADALRRPTRGPTRRGATT